MKSIAGFGLASGLFAFGAHAQEGAPPAPPELAGAVEAAGAGPEEASEHIVVTDKRPGKTAFDSAEGVNVVDEQRLDELNPRTTAEALRSQPGVWVQRTGHGGGAPIIRGFMGNQVVYLFDGIRRNTASIFGGPNGLLNTTDPAAVKRVEVIRGPGSVLYGSDAIGGVVNVISAHPLDFTDEGRRYLGEMRSWFATVDGEKTVTVEAGLVTPTLLLNLGGSAQSVGDVEGGGDLGTLKPTASNYQAVDGQLAIRLGGHGTLELLGQYFQDPEETRFDRPDRLTDNRRQMYVARFHGAQVGPFKRLLAEAYFHRQTSKQTSPNATPESQDDTIGGEVRGTTRLGPVELTTGLHYHTDHIEGRDKTSETVDAEVDWHNPAIYALASWFTTERLTIEAGARFDYFALSSKAPSANLVPLGLEAEDLGIERTTQALTGGVGTIFGVTEHLNWVTHASTAFRAPGKNELLDAGEFTFGFRVPPAEAPGPERSLTVQTGLRMDHRRVEAGLDVFYTLIQDVITSQPTTFNGSEFVDYDGDGNVGQAEDDDDDEQTAIDERAYSNTNEGEAKAYGIEGAVRIFLVDALHTYGNFTWMSGVEGEDEEVLDRMIPPNATLGLRWQDRRAAPRFFAEVEGVGALAVEINPVRRGADPAFKVDPQDRNSASLLENDGKDMPGFLIFNARAGAKVLDHLDLTLALENISNEAYREKDSRLDAPGFGARIGIAVHQ